MHRCCRCLTPHNQRIFWASRPQAGLAADSLTFMSQQLPVSPVQFRWDPAFLSQLSSAPMQAPAPQQAPASSRKRRRQRPASPS